MTTIWILGSGAREHAIASKIAEEHPKWQICGIPGNAGMNPTYPYMSLKKLADVVELAKREKPDLTIFGPEDPLVAGGVDLFTEAGLLALGPSRAAAQVEGSKMWFKQFLLRHNLPTAYSTAFRHDLLREAMGDIANRSGGHTIVLKADGLCGGKGVHLPEDDLDAGNAFLALHEKFPAASEYILIEKRLFGLEYSVIGITDGKTVYPFAFTRDYKRAEEGDRGPNTGGMGAHTIHLPPNLEVEAIELLNRVVAGLAEEGIPYRGFLYLGLMLTDEGFKILEANCRLGDPETQVILASMGDGFTDLCFEAAEGNILNLSAPRQVCEALGVVLTSNEYPEPSTRDAPLLGIEKAEELGARIYQGGTARSAGKSMTNRAGRILTSVGCGKTLRDAYLLAYAGAHAITCEGEPLKFRTDIGRDALAG